MSRPPLVDLSNSEPEDVPPDAWDEEYWISPHNPRIYPSLDVPKVVSNCRALILSYPPECAALLPPKTLPVSSLLKDWSTSPSPRQSPIDTGLHFDDAHPDPNLHAILNVLRVRSTIPPLDHLLNLEEHFGQAWFDGKHSIIDSYYARIPLPFWIITLWKEYHELFCVHSRWLSAEEVIRSASDPDIDYKIRKEADSIVGSLQQVACALQTSEYEGNIKARASGYYHTHYSTRGLDRKALSSCPTHVVIKQCALIACQESHALVSICGTPLTRAICQPPSTSNPSTETRFVTPSIFKWFLDKNEDLDDSWNDSNIACELDGEGMSPGVELDQLLRNEEVRRLSTAVIDD
ncbi:hypothetical protein FRC11_012175 [Ceratobasidium sp. 423]|nr:hypothetical protein FRC11_012175 [Ceratobasidium sp. 423]